MLTLQHAVPCNAFTSALRLVAASLKICYEMCQTSTVQGFVHCRSSVTQASQVSRLKPTGLLCVGMDERTALQCEGGNVSCKEQLEQFTTEWQPMLRPVVAFSKTSFKHRSVQMKGNFTKLTLHLYFKCIMYYAGLLFCSVYCQ